MKIRVRHKITGNCRYIDEELKHKFAANGYVIEPEPKEPVAKKEAPKQDAPKKQTRKTKNQT